MGNQQSGPSLEQSQANCQRQVTTTLPNTEPPVKFWQSVGCQSYQADLPPGKYDDLGRLHQSI